MQYVVQVNHIETASLYFGCRLDSETREKDEEVHNVCFYLSGDNRPFNISVGKVQTFRLFLHFKLVFMTSLSWGLSLLN